MKLPPVFQRILNNPFLPLIAAPLVLFAPLLTAGKALVWGTPSTQFFPWWDFAWGSLQAGELPLWNPLLGMGAPLAANYQSALFYPPSWIYLIVHWIGGVEWMAYAATWMVCLHLIWAGIGMAVFLRHLELKPVAQTVGGLAFSLSGYLVARAGFLSINAAVSWLPWVLWAGVRLAERRQSGFWRLVLSVTFLLLAGHAQTAWYVLLLGASWCIFWSIRSLPAGGDPKQALWTGLKFAAGSLLAAGISAIQILPTIEYLLNSQRSVEYGFAEAMTYSFWPWRFLTLFVPDLFGSPSRGDFWGYGNYYEDAIYVGLLPVLLALGWTAAAMLRAGRRKTRQKKLDGTALFLAAVLVISFLFALGENTPLYPFLYRHVPTFDLFQAPTRWSIWGVSSLAILAAIGIDQLEVPQGRQLYFTRLAAAASLAVTGGSYLAWRLIRDLEATFFSATARAGLIGFLAILLVLSIPRSPAGTRYLWWRSLAVTLVAIDLISAGWGLNPGTDRKIYSPSAHSGRRGRTWMPADVEYELKFEHYFRFDSFDPRSPWSTLAEVSLPNYSMLQGIEFVNNFDPIVPGSYQTWMERLNQGGGHPDVLALMDVGEVISWEGGMVIRRLEHLPEDSRLRVAGCAGVLSDEEKILDLVMEEAGKYYSDLLLSGEVDQSCQPGALGSAEVLEGKNGYLRLMADLDRDGWIFWSQTWYPGWKARIDNGQKFDVQTANFIFQAVPVPSGRHQVEFFYQPASYLWGGGITALSMAVSAGGWFLERSKRKGF